MFQFTGSCPLYPIFFRYRCYRFACNGFPHSDIHGSMLACSSPWRFAAGRVLLRLLAPRHPPYALFFLTLFARVSFVSATSFFFFLTLLVARLKSFCFFLSCAVFKDLCGLTTVHQFLLGFDSLSSVHRGALPLILPLGSDQPTQPSASPLKKG